MKTENLGVNFERLIMIIIDYLIEDNKFNYLENESMITGIVFTNIVNKKIPELESLAKDL